MKSLEAYFIIKFKWKAEIFKNIEKTVQPLLSSQTGEADS